MIKITKCLNLFFITQSNVVTQGDQSVCLGINMLSSRIDKKKRPLVSVLYFELLNMAYLISVSNLKIVYTHTIFGSFSKRSSELIMIRLQYCTELGAILTSMLTLFDGIKNYNNKLLIKKSRRMCRSNSSLVYARV